MAFVTVEGKIGRVFYEGKGAEVVETFTAQGKEVTKRWSAFFDQPHGLNVGAAVKVTGIHGDKVDEWDDKETGDKRHAVKRSINKTRIDGPRAPKAEVDPSELPF